MFSEVNFSQAVMKPLVLTLTVALFATLLNLASAGKDAGMQVVASSIGYEKRQFPTSPTLACVDVMGWENLAEGKMRLQNIASGANDKKQTVLLGTPTIMFKMTKPPYLQYCKYVTDGLGIRSITDSQTNDSIEVDRFPRYAFYAQRAADESPEEIKATAAKVKSLLKAFGKDRTKRTLEGIFMVEITATNEVYVGSMDYTAASTGR